MGFDNVLRMVHGAGVNNMKRTTTNERQPMRTVGVKIPIGVWEELQRAAIFDRNAHPGYRTTVSDIIRRRIMSDCHNTKPKTEKQKTH